MQSLAATVAVALTTAVAGAHGPSDGPRHTPRGCARHFTVRMAERGIRAAYDGTGQVTVRQRRKINWYIRCQWDTRHRAMLRSRRNNARHDWWRRTHPPFQSAFVSYYDDAGTHCCGLYTTYGVAVCGVSGVCVPQGTRIEFCDRRCVVAIADDHGPYVAGRAFDLNSATAAAIGFSGLGYVRYRVLP